jgi:hypothetical protein
MAQIFGFIELEDVVQVDDRTRLSASKSYISKDSMPVTLVRIEPEAGAGFIEVGAPGSYKDWFCDWQYSTPGTKVVSLEITTDAAPVIFTKTLEVLTAAEDILWSADSDLTAYEPDVLKWTPIGRNSFLNVHRTAQRLILDWLNSIRVWKQDGTKLTKDDMATGDDLRKLSTFWALESIFFGISNKVDDVFLAKSRTYSSKRKECQDTTSIMADFNGDGEVETNERSDLRSVTMVRR